MTKPKRECVYCGSRKRLTDDHIPPKGLFPKPRPSNLITVPCCRKCNESASKDDEYFRAMLSWENRAGEHPDASKVSRSVLRSLQRPQAGGFTKHLLDNIFDLDLYSTGGIYIGRRAGYWVDYKRIDRVAARIVKGLFYDTFGVRLPENWKAKCWNEAGLAHTDFTKVEWFTDIFRPMIERPPDNVLGDQVFEYWFQRAMDNDYATVWALRFYKSVSFLGITSPMA